MKKAFAVVAVLLVLTASEALAGASCRMCEESHGYSVGQCGLCIIETIFDLLGGW